MGKAEELLKAMGGAIQESASHRGTPTAMPTLAAGPGQGGDRLTGVFSMQTSDPQTDRMHTSLGLSVIVSAVVSTAVTASTPLASVVQFLRRALGLDEAIDDDERSTRVTDALAVIGSGKARDSVRYIADLLGVPEADHAEFRDALSRQPGSGGVGSTKTEMSHSPLEWLYDRFSHYIEDRRKEPRDDVLTALATTRFPNGELPEVIDVVRVATNVFAAGQETTVRLLGTALQLIG